MATLWQKERTTMRKQSGLNFSTVAHCILNCAGKGYTVARMRQWICDDVGFGIVCDPSDFSNSINKGKPIVGFAYDYYENAQNLPAITDSIQKNVIDVVPSIAVLMDTLKSEVYKDASILPEVAEELLTGTNAEIAAKILRYSIIRQTKEKQKLSPIVEEMLEDVEVPSRAPKMIGRESELEIIRERLTADKKLFVIGVGGVGKSELVQNYARKYAKQYTNHIYLTYQKSIHTTIASIRLKNEPETANPKNFERNLRLLRSMKEDSLLIIDNLDELPEKSGDLKLLEKLNCHVLVTTRLKTRGKYGFFLDMINNRDDLLNLFYTYCPKQLAGNEEDVWQLIELVHHHTYAVQLLALTVKAGYRTSGELAGYISEQGLAFPNSIFVETNKDGNYDWKPFYDLLDGLFALQGLNEQTQNGLINFSIMPETGVRKRQFMLWTQMIVETQSLVRLGWLQEDENTGKLYIHGLVRDMVTESLHPTVEKCSLTIDAILETCYQYSRNYCLEDYENSIEALACKPYIIKLMNHNLTIYNNIYLTLFSLYGLRIQYEASKKLYEAKKASTGAQEEAYLMQMKKEQLDDLREWDLKIRKYCGEKLERGQQYCALNNELYNDLYSRAVEEFAELERIYQQCKTDLNHLIQTASYGTLMKIRTKGKHSKGRNKPVHR
jgi:hypothetical protein